jgi:hypothetical protein
MLYFSALKSIVCGGQATKKSVNFLKRNRLVFYVFKHFKGHQKQHHGKP